MAPVTICFFCIPGWDLKGHLFSWVLVSGRAQVTVWAPLVYQTSFVRLLKQQSCLLRTEPRHLVLGATLWPTKRDYLCFSKLTSAQDFSRNPYESSLPSQFPSARKPPITPSVTSHPTSQHRRSRPLRRAPKLAEKILIGKEEERSEAPFSAFDSRQLGLRASGGLR